MESSTLKKVVFGLCLLLLCVEISNAQSYACTLAGLTSAVKTTGTKTFTCGTAKIITLTSTLALPTSITIEGGGLLTLKANSGVSMFSAAASGANSIIFQNISIVTNGPSTNGTAGFIKMTSAGNLMISNSMISTQADTYSFIDVSNAAVTVQYSSVQAANTVNTGIVMSGGSLDIKLSTFYSANTGTYPYSMSAARNTSASYVTFHGWNALPVLTNAAARGFVFFCIFSGYNTVGSGVTSLSSTGYNLIQQSAGYPISFVSSDSVNQVPQFEAFGNYGGFTNVLPYKPCSPGINAGPLLSGGNPTPDFDQRGPGFVRSQQSTPDIGAFESNYSPCLTWNPISQTVTEANTAVVFELRLSGRSSASIALTVKSMDGTATAGNDYSSVSGTVNFQFNYGPNKGMYANVTVNILNDNVYEGTEYFTLNVSPQNSGQSVNITNANATVTIVDDDPISTGITSKDLSTGVTSKDLSTGVTSRSLSTGVTSRSLSTGVTSKDLSTGVTSKDLSTGVTSKDLSTGVTSKDLSTGVTSKDLSTGVTSKDLSTGVTSKDLSTGVTSKDLSTGVTSKDLSTGVTSKDLSTGVTSKDLSTGVTSKDLSTGVTSKDLSTGVTSKDLSTGVTSKDLSTGVTSKDLSTGVTSADLSTGVTSKDLSTGVTSKDLSTGVTSADLSTGVTSKDLSTGVTSADLSTGVTSADLSTGVTSADLSTGVTSADLSTGVTSKDLSTGVTSKDLSTGVTSKDLSTGVTSKDLSTGVTSKDLSTGVTSKDLSTGVTSRDLSTGITSKDLSTGITSRDISTGITTKKMGTTRSRLIPVFPYNHNS